MEKSERRRMRKNHRLQFNFFIVFPVQHSGALEFSSVFSAFVIS
jgi:hypothetical protein